MPITWTDHLTDIDWHELSALYAAAPLGNKSPENLQTVFTNSMFRCFVRENGQLVGVGRVLADGVDCAYICDIAVLPSHHGTGLGKQIVGHLVELSRGHRKIILYAVPGKEGFYRKLGFQRMTTAMAIFDDQAGALARGYIQRDLRDGWRVRPAMTDHTAQFEHQIGHQPFVHKRKQLLIR